VRQLLPAGVDDLDLDAAYLADLRPALATRPWVVLNMVVSVDGATTVEGRSGGLGGTADHIAFAALRSVADVILVGAATVRAERYGPPRPSQIHQAQRVARGQSPFPRLAIVSGRLDLDLDSSLFTDSPNRPYVITSQSPTDPVVALEAIRARADVIGRGEGHADVAAALEALRDDGVEVVLCEGGPTLNDQLLAGGLVDELCVTIAPLLAGGTSKRMIAGPAPAQARSMRLDRVVEDEDALLLRYVRPD
jgi:riboflavin biosynthesis pyrimidine reductase